MKNTKRVLKFTSALAAPAICTWALAGCELSADFLFGAYALTGLFYIAAADYSPGKAFDPATCAPKTTRSWVHRSFSAPNRSTRGLRANKTAA